MKHMTIRKISINNIDPNLYDKLHKTLYHTNSTIITETTPTSITILTTHAKQHILNRIKEK